LKSVARATGTPSSTQRRAGQHEGGAGEEHGDRARACEGGEVGVVGVLEVVDARGAQVGGEPGAAEVALLLRVEFGQQAVGASRLEDAAGLLDGEGAVLAEDIVVAGEAGHRDRGDGLVADEAHVRVGIVAVLGGHGVRREEGGDDGLGAGVGEAAGRAQELQLVGRGEAVAALDLDGGRAVAEHGREEAGRAFDEGVFGEGPRGADGVQDATAGLQDLQVVGALQAEGELVGAVAAEDGVRVGVDEAGEDGAAGGVDDARVGGDLDGRADVGGRADGEDAAVVADGHGAVGDEA
jgi:hypothetical protein